MASVNLKVCLLIAENDKVLLIREKSEKDGLHKWNSVKGTIENEDILSGAVREAKEEVNVEVSLTNSLGVHVKYYGGDSNKYTVYFLYSAKIVNGEPKLTDVSEQADRSEDIIELKWFAKEELEKLKTEDFVSDVSFLLVKKWLNNEIYALDAVTSQSF